MNSSFTLDIGFKEEFLGDQVEFHSIRSREVNDFYRCPESFLEFAVHGDLSSDRGYFRFGEKLVCHGSSYSGVGKAQAGSSLHDTLIDVVVDDGQVKLPFDPDEVIENLRRERYAGGRKFWSGSQNILKRLYYLLRPVMNRSMRKRFQKFRIRNWRKLSFPRWPVDTTVEDLCEKLLLLSMEAKGIDRIPFVWFWPAGARGCVLMTHDVETDAGMRFCNELMDLDDSFGIKASFSIVPEGRYPVSRTFLEGIRNRGFDFCVQDLNHDGRLFDNKEEFMRRAASVNRYAEEWGARGFRAAVLYRRPEWYDCLNFAFDMSIPNVAHIDPQRGGCCTVMPYFIGDMLELPQTTVQDYSLFHLLDDHSIDLWKGQMDLILKKNGLVSFIVHPDYIIERAEQSVYLSLLEHLRDLREEGETWFALPADVDLWWRARSRMSVEMTDNSLQIVGEGSERAVLAYAVRRDGKLIYEVPNSGQNLLRADAFESSNYAHC